MPYDLRSSGTGSVATPNFGPASLQSTGYYERLAPQYLSRSMGDSADICIYDEEERRVPKFEINLSDDHLKMVSLETIGHADEGNRQKNLQNSKGFTPKLMSTLDPRPQIQGVSQAT